MKLNPNEEVAHSALENASVDKEQLYQNVQKLMPLYNKSFIVKLANEVNSGSLLDKKLLSVTPMIGEKIVTNPVREKAAIHKIMLHFADDSVEYISVSYVEDYNGVIAEYSLENSPLIYTPESYVDDYSVVIKAVKNDFQSISFLSDEMFAILNLPQDQGNIETIEMKN